MGHLTYHMKTFFSFGAGLATVGFLTPQNSLSGSGEGGSAIRNIGNVENIEGFLIQLQQEYFKCQPCYFFTLRDSQAIQMLVC